MLRQLADIECPECKNIFRPREAKSIYCSRACYWSARRKDPRIGDIRVLPDYICLQCKKPYRPTHAERQYCSLECYRKAAKRLLPRNCKQCGKQFEPRHADALYCSHNCSVQDRSQRYVKTCSIEGCDRPTHAKGLCSMHYSRLRSTGQPEKNFRQSYTKQELYEKLQNGEQVGSIDKWDGYVKISVDAKSMPAHRFVYEYANNMKLTREQVVHHKNKIRTDNRIENLELCDKSQPPGGRVRDLIEYANYIIAKYGNDPSKY